MKFRWLNKIWANLWGYFWLPCPLCGEYFGGHELRIDLPNSSIYESPGMYAGVCPNCHGAAKAYNEKIEQMS